MSQTVSKPEADRKPNEPIIQTTAARNLVIKLLIEGRRNDYVIASLRRAKHIKATEDIPPATISRWRQWPEVVEGKKAALEATLEAAIALRTRGIEIHADLTEVAARKLKEKRGVVFVESPPAAQALLKAIADGQALAQTIAGKDALELSGTVKVEHDISEKALVSAIGKIVRRMKDQTSSTGTGEESQVSE